MTGYTLDAVSALIAERLPGKRYGIYYATGEGDLLPNGEEESSGSVVDEDGRHYFYWTGACGECGTIVLDRWEEVGTEAYSTIEYLGARFRAGLGYPDA